MEVSALACIPPGTRNSLLYQLVPSIFQQLELLEGPAWRTEIYFLGTPTPVIAAHPEQVSALESRVRHPTLTLSSGRASRHGQSIPNSLVDPLCPPTQGTPGSLCYCT